MADRETSEHLRSIDKWLEGIERDIAKWDMFKCPKCDKFTLGHKDIVFHGGFEFHGMRCLGCGTFFERQLETINYKEIETE